MQRSEFRHIIGLPVRWGDMDALGHVNNVQYFRYLESGRIAYFSEVPPADLQAVAHLVLADMRCTFLRQLHYPASLEIGTRISRLGSRSMDVQCAIFIAAEDAPAATSTAVLVWFDFQTRRAAPLPQALRAAVAAFEGLTG